MNTGLPKAACIGGRRFRIRSDFREILDICAALNDPDLTDQDRAEVAVKIFYPDWDQITDMAAAVKFMLWFLDGGVDRGDQRQQPKQMDWEQDFPMIIAPINRVAGRTCEHCRICTGGRSSDIIWRSVTAHFPRSWTSGGSCANTRSWKSGSENTTTKTGN